MHYKITIDFSDKNSSFMSPTITSTASTDSPSSSIVDQCHRSNMPDLVPHHPYYYHHHAQWVKNLWKIAKYLVSQDKLKLISFFSLALPLRYWKKNYLFKFFYFKDTVQRNIGDQCQRQSSRGWNFQTTATTTPISSPGCSRQGRRRKFRWQRRKTSKT